MRKVTFAAIKREKRAPLLWRVASFLPHSSTKLAPRWTHHRGSGAEVFIPWRESSAHLPPPYDDTILFLIRVGSKPWQRWKAPIVVERALAATPVYIIALSWHGIERSIFIVSSRQIPLRWQGITFRLSESHKTYLHETTSRWRGFVAQVTTMNQNISSLVLRRSRCLQVCTPRIKLFHRDLPTVSYRFRRRVTLSPFSATTGDHDV